MSSHNVAAIVSCTVHNSVMLIMCKRMLHALANTALKEPLLLSLMK
jgi:hypothetical protein